MQKLHRKPAHFRPVVAQHEFPIVCAERTQLAHLNIMQRADRLELLNPFRGHGQHHSLLRFGDPDFRWAESFVFQRRLFKIHLRTELFAHFTNGAGEPTGSTIGDRGEQTTIFVIASRKHDIEQFLFRHRVADLHSMAELIGVNIGQLG